MSKPLLAYVAAGFRQYEFKFQLYETFQTGANEFKFMLYEMFQTGANQTTNS